MTANKRISELILEIEYGINGFDGEVSQFDGQGVREIEKKSTENLLKLERAFFSKFTDVNEGISKFD